MSDGKKIWKVEDPLKWEKFFCFALILSGVLLRFYRIDLYPATFNQVSTRYMVLLSDILNGHHYFPRGPAMCEFDETMMVYLTVPFSRIFGFSIFFFRVFTACVSLALLPAVFYFCKVFLNSRVAWISTVFMASSCWFIRSAHVYHRLRYDLGVACGLVSLALLADLRLPPIRRGLMASALSALGLYLQACNAVTIICCFIYLLIMWINGKSRSIKLIVTYCTVFVVVIHTGAALKGTSNRKGHHVLRFQFSRSQKVDIEDPVSIEKPATKNGNQVFKLKDPKRKYGRVTSEQVFLKNLGRIPLELMGLPVDDYLRCGHTSIHNQAIGFCIGIGVVLLLFRTFRTSSIPVLLMFSVWYPLQSLLRPNKVETLYYTPGIIASLIFAASALVFLIQRTGLSPRYRRIIIMILVMSTASWELVRSRMIIHETSEYHQTPSMRLYNDIKDGQYDYVVTTLKPHLDDSCQRYMLMTMGENAVSTTVRSEKLVSAETSEELILTSSLDRSTTVFVSDHQKNTVLKILENLPLVEIEQLPQSGNWKLVFAAEIVK